MSTDDTPREPTFQPLDEDDIPNVSRQVDAVLDAATCAACRTRHGTVEKTKTGEQPPALERACERVQAGTGICRCVYRRT
jgi:hypothetical protein